MLGSLSRRIGLGALAALLTGCGSGGGETATGDDGVWIEEPTAAATFATDQPTVRLAGRAFVPAGARCTGILGSLPAGYEVRWRNEASDASMPAKAQLNCLLQVTVSWTTADIPLTLGENRIAVTALAPDGRRGADTLTVLRTPDTTPPRVLSIAPADGANFVDTAVTIVVNFSEPVDEISLRQAWTVRVTGAPAPLSGSVIGGLPPGEYAFLPASPLAPATTYEVRIEGVTDRNGLPLPAPFVSRFTTRP
ncbi:MAG: Ig-like domain-containing protein [Burkholderiaceae bacterium]|nr:Ig-like domain-containing protein [Burkholderiaceae bacterium]